MTGLVAAAIGLAILLGLFAFGVPMFAAFILINLIGVLAYFGAPGFGLFANSMYEMATASSFLTVPMYILMGEIMLLTGVVNAMFKALDDVIGGLRGRDYVVCTALSAIIGSLAGTAMGVAAMMGRSVLPTMTGRGCNKQMSAGVVMAGACLAPIIPPSVLTVLIGSLADVSIAKLLVGGILPGLMIAGVIVMYIQIKVRSEPVRARPPVQPGAWWRAVLKITPFMLVLSLVMGLIIFGIATPSEAAAAGVLGSLLMAPVYDGLSWRILGLALASTARLSAVLLVILASSALFNQLLAFTGATTLLLQLMKDYSVGPYTGLALMLGIGFLLFMVVDPVPFLLIVIPFFTPMVKAFQFDPIWFWNLFLINATIGAITPPFGVVMFALRASTDQLSLQEIFRAAWPMVGIYYVATLILILFPSIITVLPSLM